MHKQDNTNRDKGLESIMESMYKEDEDTGRIPHDVDSFGTKKDYDPTKSRFYVKDDPDNDRNIAQDNRAQNLQTITPLDELAKKYGADDIIDWLAQQVEQPGSDFVDDFEQQIMIKKIKTYER